MILTHNRRVRAVYKRIRVCLFGDHGLWWCDDLTALHIIPKTSKQASERTNERMDERTDRASNYSQRSCLVSSQSVNRLVSHLPAR